MYFSAWKEGAIHYIPSLAVAVFCLFLAVKGYRGAWVGVLVFGAYGLMSLFFFRDPPRQVLASASDIVSPADGTIVGIEDLKESPFYNGPCRRVSIFLSVFDVHVNRAPVAGTVTDVRYLEGEYKNAMKASSSQTNESNCVMMDSPQGPVSVRQISGAVARRIVCNAKVGDSLEKGQKFGMIKLGSRTELYLPPKTEVSVKLKEKVHAGTSIIARF
jgi:phosphatidylserine decarboxylase